MESKIGGPPNKEQMEIKQGPCLIKDFAKKLGILGETVSSAMKYCNFVEEEPEKRRGEWS